MTTDRQRFRGMSRRPVLGLVLGLAVAVLVAGCGSATSDEPVEDATEAGQGTEAGQQDTTFPSGSFAVVANADIGVGTSRLLVGVVGEDGSRLGSPSDDVVFAVVEGDGSGAVQEIEPVWTWIFEPVIGLWRADVDVPRSGPWQVAVVPADGHIPRPAVFEVRDETIAPNVGDIAPAPDTPTLADTPVEALTTDREPDERFYQSSLSDAIDAGSETVLVFATPAYCTSAACGPLLDITKQLAPEYPDVEFIHVEVYTGFEEPGFAPSPENLAPALGPDYWNLPSEPWVFVIDRNGLVSARYEGVMTPEELANALDSL